MFELLKQFFASQKSAKRNHPNQTSEKIYTPNIETIPKNDPTSVPTEKNWSELEAAKKNLDAANLSLESSKKNLEASSKHLEASNKTVKVSIVVCILGGILSLLGPVISSSITAHSNEKIAKNKYLKESPNGDYGKLDYRERAIYTIYKSNNYVYIRPFPYDSAPYMDRKALADNPTFTIEAVVINLLDRKWYRLAPDVHQYLGSASGQAYIFSDRLQFLKEAAIISWEWGDENIKGQQLPYGKPLSIQGTICSTNQIKDISLAIEPDITKEGSKHETINKSEELYSFKVETSNLNYLQFENLPVRNDYRLVLTVTFFCNGRKDVAKKIIEYPFEIIDIP